MTGSCLPVTLRSAVAQALLDDEPWIGAVNWTETVSALVESGSDEATVLEALAQLRLHVEPLNAEVALLAAQLRPPTRKRGLFLGDRCCLALGHVQKAQVVTAGRPRLKLKGFDILAIR